MPAPTTIKSNTLVVSLMTVAGAPCETIAGRMIPDKICRPAGEAERYEYAGKHVSRGSSPCARRPGRFLGRSGDGVALGAPLGSGAGLPPRSLLSLVHRWAHQHLLQRARPTRRAGPCRAGRAHL